MLVIGNYGEEKLHISDHIFFLVGDHCKLFRTDLTKVWLLRRNVGLEYFAKASNGQGDDYLLLEPCKEPISCRLEGLHMINVPEIFFQWIINIILT